MVASSFYVNKQLFMARILLVFFRLVLVSVENPMSSSETFKKPLKSRALMLIPKGNPRLCIGLNGYQVRIIFPI